MSTQFLATCAPGAGRWPAADEGVQPQPVIPNTELTNKPSLVEGFLLITVPVGKRRSVLGSTEPISVAEGLVSRDDGGASRDNCDGAQISGGEPRTHSMNSRNRAVVHRGGTSRRDQRANVPPPSDANTNQNGWPGRDEGGGGDDCQSFRLLMAGYISRSLDQADRERLLAHVRTCNSCFHVLMEVRVELDESGDEASECL